MPPTGTQYDIVHGDQIAVITEVGATLRSYQAGGRDVVASFPEDGLPAGCQGQQLLPWPNRIRDGRYDWNGETHQLPINELERNNAIHGLLNWVPWQLAELYPSLVRLRTVLHPQPGWPGTLECHITHWLDDSGLSVEVSVRNIGDAAVPFGYAAHPYLTLDETIDDATLLVPFKHYLAVDERLLPVELRPVSDDERAGQPLGSATYDTAFCSPQRDETGRWRVRFTRADHACSLWGDEALGWLQIYTPSDRRSIAVEPMTCGPDAFNPGPTHSELITLAPGATFSCTWGIEPR